MRNTSVYTLCFYSHFSVSWDQMRSEVLAITYTSCNSESYIFSVEFCVQCARECILGWYIHSSAQQMSNNRSLASCQTQPRFLLWELWLLKEMSLITQARIWNIKTMSSMASLWCYLVYIRAVLPLESLANSTLHLCAGSSPAERLSSYCFFLSNLKHPSPMEKKIISHLPTWQQEYLLLITF